MCFSGLRDEVGIAAVVGFHVPVDQPFGAVATSGRFVTALEA